MMKDSEEFGRPLTEYERGYVEGLGAYAWWKDGTQYVGTTGNTLRHARRRFLEERPKPGIPTLYFTPRSRHLAIGATVTMQATFLEGEVTFRVADIQQDGTLELVRVEPVEPFAEEKT